MGHHFEKNSIRIASWNIRCGLPHPSMLLSDFESTGLKFIIDCLKISSIDIVGLQEVIFEDENNSQAIKIAQGAGFEYCECWKLSDCHLKKNASMGIALLSKHVIKNTKRIKLINPITGIKNSNNILPIHDKGFIQSQIEFKGQEIDFITGHGYPFHSLNLESLEFKYIYENFEESLQYLFDSDRLAIICGDFNSQVMPFLMPRIFSRYNSIINSSTRPIDRCDDYILCSNHFEVLNTWIIPSISDHFFCAAELKIKSKLN